MQNDQTELLKSYYWLNVAFRVPMGGLFEYKSESFIKLGSRVIVPFGKRTMIGIVVDHLISPTIDPKYIKNILDVIDDLPSLNEDWIRLIKFTADYYQRSIGDVVYSVIPSPLRTISSYNGKRSKGGPVVRAYESKSGFSPKEYIYSNHNYELEEQQKRAIEIIVSSLGEFKTILVHGVTGSGKTEVYLRSACHVLSMGKQVLFLVPEINLTPQLENAVRSHFANIISPEEILVVHSGISMQKRVLSWAMMQRSQVKVVLGTRMSIFSPLSNLGLIVIDEEHDISYKQQSRLRYSARDVAIWRAKDLGIPILLGSATPSLETWNHVNNKKYLLVSLDKRIKNICMPSIKLINTAKLPYSTVLTKELQEAIDLRLQRKEQSLIFINRRGYAPVFHCYACGWVSSCSRCSVFTVLHVLKDRSYRLQCHHCGLHSAIPRTCPICGNQDLKAMGLGTQSVEEELSLVFPQAKILRIDSDTARGSSVKDLLSDVNNGEIDILIGTQMLSKGHNFTKVSLVGVINSDSMIFSQDFRASERLFAQLMQVSGRSGRYSNGEVIIQTSFPDHSVYQSLVSNDYIGFANNLLKERKKTLLPPFSFQALLTAESKNIETSIKFLEESKFIIEGITSKNLSYNNKIICYDPLPARVFRVANIEKAQLLIEGHSRHILLSLLRNWLSLSSISFRKNNKVNWSIEIDPLEI
ncbi:superfamily II primosomal protein N' [Candidatus Kinetoplastibacterium desouzaii TCC079E]|uniref:Replication restart protein PriA n=1 Tax=Candidatus Kinetoplastidibacterium desouzai TCC079E TaxID=1208919 RepID=M1LTH0_9PROT|nr:primosomal protein N' [Candidatus Kinetoplastibacterium desouzaii]AGF46619.1 superfamily II primosomal protein N' [Candidatus Kinetoplastibacterium desouzaii TCC079E]